MTVGECEEMMRDLQEHHPVEYRTYGLSSVAVAVVFPLIKSLISVSRRLCLCHFYFTPLYLGKVSDVLAENLTSSAKLLEHIIFISLCVDGVVRVDMGHVEVSSESLGHVWSLEVSPQRDGL